MWSSSGACNSSNSSRVSSSSSKPSSTCSSPSPFSPSSPIPTTLPPRKTMDEVWKHFLVRPFNEAPPTRGDSSEPPFSTQEAIFINSSLNSGPESHYLESTVPAFRPNPQTQSHVSETPPRLLSSINSPFPALASPSSVLPSFYNKRAPENDDGNPDHRHKRMMKNRESAARSRARKQVYITELEQEVARLRKENARLEQQEKIWAAAPARLPKRRTLSRTATAPF